MKTQYGNFIKIVPAHQVSAIDGGTITLESGYSFDELDTLNNLQPSEEAKTSEAGVLYTFSMQAGVEKFSDTLKHKYGSDCPVILTIFKSHDEEALVVGSLQNPVRMTWTPHPEYDHLDFSRSSISAVL